LTLARPGMVCIAIPLYLDTEVARHAIWDAWVLHPDLIST
jgi:hypothetical protein